MATVLSPEILMKGGNIMSQAPCCSKGHAATFPRIIHQTYKTEIIPEHWQASQDTWKSKHAGFQYVFWTDSDILVLVTKFYPQYLEIYNNLKYNIMRVDFARALILFKFGGIYSDLDVVPSVSFVEYMQFVEKSYPHTNTMLAEGPSPMLEFFLTNFILVSKPGARDFWPHYIEHVVTNDNSLVPWYLRALQTSKHYYVMTKTGPTAVSIVHKHLAQKNLTNNIHIIPSTFVGGGKVYNKSGSVDADALFGHVEGSSWTGNSSESCGVAMQLYDSRETFLICALVLFMLLFITFTILYIKKK